MLKYTKACQTLKIESSLCGCLADCSSCCYSVYCCPCAVPQSWADSRDESCSFCHCIVCPTNLWTRQNIRYARGMKPRFCQDCIECTFCYCCFLNQNMREIKLIASDCQKANQNLSNGGIQDISQYSKPGPPNEQE
ncbi:hypothetical protein M9Y10_011063 [Tritrichomonas musculus]|uniref:Uncharacterized protein n=1 Tax=Tritrichomonas musculus TaxID=1915356 RepID=A0ABR2IME6_9EUKA